MKKNLFLLSLIILPFLKLKAQDFPYGTFTVEEMNMASYPKDTSAHAVVLNEYGKYEYIESSEAGTDYVKVYYTHHVKIKIFDKLGYGQGEVSLPVYSSDGEYFETIEGLKGITTYKDASGNIKTVNLDESKTYREKLNNHVSLLKFAMPGITDGCIIEYTYHTLSPYTHNLDPWYFQSDIPKIYSELDLHLPAFWNFNVSLVGPLKLTKNTGEAERDCFSFHGAQAGCSHMVYGMKDIPAFIEEEDMTSPDNYRSAIKFELAEFTNLQSGGITKVTQEWKDVDYELKHDDYFGGQLKRKSLLQEKIAPVIAGKTSEMDKAKAIYVYIAKNIKWDDMDSRGSVDGIRKALETKSGNAGDINLALTTALNAAGLNAGAVLLSTRDNGNINMLYPGITSFNYVVTKVDIDGKFYLLDATDPLLPFGMLPLRCINDKGRVMSLDKPSYWISMDTTHQKRNITHVIDLTLQADGKLKGTLTNYFTGYSAYEERERIHAFNSFDEYVENLDEKSPHFKITHAAITDLDSLDEPLSEKFEVEIKEFKSLDADEIHFNPYIIDYYSRNPYRLQERTYPVDRGMPSSERYMFTLHLPYDFVVGRQPEKAAVRLPNGGGIFITDFNDTDSTLTFSHIIQFNKSIYSSAEYPYLKEFFNKIILTQKAEMVLKHKK